MLFSVFIFRAAQINYMPIQFTFKKINYNIHAAILSIKLIRLQKIKKLAAQTTHSQNVITVLFLHVTGKGAAFMRGICSTEVGFIS